MEASSQWNSTVRRRRRHCRRRRRTNLTSRITRKRFELETPNLHQRSAYIPSTILPDMTSLATPGRRLASFV